VKERKSLEKENTETKKETNKKKDKSKLRAK
jgi:hypothetical protein